jgi:hypothetical protein
VLHGRGVGDVIGIRPNDAEAQPQRLDLLTIAGAGGNDRFVTASLETQRDGEIRMQVAE